MNRLGWCETCNVPILDGLNCGICYKQSIPMRFTKTELKPVFEEESNYYRNILLQNKITKSILPDELFFYNVMGEIVIDGQKVFRLSFNRDRNEFVPFFFKKFIDAVPLFHGSNLDLTIAANEKILINKENEAVNFLKSEIQKFDKLPVAVSFSGGKDSAVAMALTKIATSNFDAIFLNTTVEFEETIDYVHQISNIFNVNLIETNPPHEFFQLCEEFGPPSTKMKWCCKTQKFSPQNLLINDRYSEGVLVINGIRKNESNIRSKFSRIQRNKMIPKQVLAFPLLDWTSLDVWLYLMWKKIPHNKMYDYGFSRIGCWACPEKSLRDFKLLETFHANLFSKLGEMLKKYAVRTEINSPDTWFRSGNWRSRKTKWIKTMACTSSIPCSPPGELVYTFERGLIQNNIIEFMKVFGKSFSKGPMTKIENPNIEISIIGNKLRVKFKNPAFLVVFEKQLTRALNCVGCGACVGACARNALSIEFGKITVSEECNSCLKCITSNGIRMSCVSVNYKTQVLTVVNS